jgi:hypothetical protein
MEHDQDNDQDKLGTKTGSGAASVLSLKEEQVLQAILSHRTLKEAALAAGISYSTLRRCMSDEGFDYHLREARREAFSQAGLRFLTASADAVTVLQDLMMNEKTPAAARITASRTIIDYSVRIAESEELKARIGRVEHFLGLKEERDALDAALGEEG